MNGISDQIAERYVTFSRSVDALLKGTNPTGKAAEVVVASDYRDFHSGRSLGIVNPPKHVAKNVADIRLAPDPASRKDLLFAFETSNGDRVWKYNGQVKTGSAQYVADSLVNMTQAPGYGKVGYVDARFVNSDGSPKVSPEAFTTAQARRLQEAKVQLRGIPDLEKRADWLVKDIRAAKSDGLDPVARQQLEQLRDGITKAYGSRRVAGRISNGAGIAAAFAAVVSLVVQLATRGKVSVRTVGYAAGTGAAFGAGGTAADAALYHLATKKFGMTPEAAKGFAQQGVAVVFCAIAIGSDLMAEGYAASSGEVTVPGAIGGTGVKTALDLLPLAMAPLGLIGLPILIAAQIGGRWVIDKAREKDRSLKLEISEDIAFADSLERRTKEFSSIAVETISDCDAADQAFLQAMKCTHRR
ncbi:hypothetical protein QU487_04740 [Crenobacter sp. SG2305]|uniref:hypothetical protein n=1 Tax=Crenobacter oryzisoli TaxID=3056844 RepID=UPI0025AB0BED|nr:hypothetical protein [Crenobacter sp. SG2305]MDN0082061.1 hypothetical protein [Crenobacter sp. SG2305]